MVKDLINRLNKLNSEIDLNKEKITQSTNENKQYRLDIKEIKEDILTVLKETDSIDDKAINHLYWELNFSPGKLGEALNIRVLPIKPKTFTAHCDKDYQYTKDKKHFANAECPCQIKKRKEQKDRWERENAKQRALSKKHEDRLKELCTMPYYEYLQTPEWKGRSREAMKKARFKCQLCGATKIKLNTHHNTYENRGNELPSDLLVLCEECHGDYSTDYKERTN